MFLKKESGLITKGFIAFKTTRLQFFEGTSLHQLQNIYYMFHGKELDFDVDTIALAETQSKA